VLADGLQICAQIGYRGLTESGLRDFVLRRDRIDHGSVGIIERTAAAPRPAVIHGVQYVFYAPSWLKLWPVG
jgi:hypothetical protein